MSNPEPYPTNPAGNAAGVRRLTQQAASIAWRLRDEDPADVWRDLAGMDRTRLEQLACVLAAMVDVDRTPAELLAWIDEPFAVREAG
jgi:hypothetical protein